MELWNKLMENEIESISLSDIAWILYCNQQYEDDVEKLRHNNVSEDEFEEILEYIKKENEYDKSGGDIEARYSSDAFDNYYKECRKKLNVMCLAIFDHTYSEMWEKTGKSYKFEVPDEASFIEYLIYIETLDVGKKIREGKYQAIEETTIKEILAGVEKLCENSKYMLKKEKSVNDIKRKFRAIPEYDKVREAIDDLQFYINNMILEKEIDECYYDGYNQIAKLIENCEKEIRDIWEKCEDNNRKKEK